jgi:hypothetical protein
MPKTVLKAAALVFSLASVVLGWPMNPLVAMVMAGSVWGVSLLLRQHRGITGIDGTDCVIAGVLIAAALGVRLASPIYFDFLQGNLSPVSTVAAPAGVHRSPTHDIFGIGAWGLGYPYNKAGCTDAPVGPQNQEKYTCGYVFDEVYFPAIFLLAPKSSERRLAAQMKVIDYELGVKLVHQAPGDTAVARAPALLLAFYGWLDALGDNVRGLISTPLSKILTTQTHPDGLWDATTGNASNKFGEQFTIEEQHERLETYLVVWASATITSSEQVLA